MNRSSPVPDFTDLIDLASERVGGAVIAANDEFFAEKENLVKAAAPMFIEGKYTHRGKWMDGWETRRRRDEGHDWCLIRLGLPGTVRGILVDTTHFTGNFPSECAVDARAVKWHLDGDELLGDESQWREIVPRSALRGDSHNLFPVADTGRVTHLRLRIFPDGGVARLRAFGVARPDWDRLIGAGGLIDLAAAEHGGLVVSASDMFFGSRHNLIMPGRPASMADGWETRRRRGPGHDWAIVRLGRAGTVRRLEIDTTYFKGNAPGAGSVEGCATGDDRMPEELATMDAWRTILPITKLQPDTRQVFEDELKNAGPVTYVRLNIFPDGGIGRLRVWAKVRDTP
ncbi:MAG: allantoicase [Acidobacteria bacterium]|nr:allantoicase [Acidobacteriota bacterium]